MINKKAIKELENIIDNNEELKNKVDRLEELKEKQRKRTSAERLKDDIEKLKHKAVEQDSMEDAKEIIRKIQDKKTELEIVENTEKPDKEEIKRLENEVNQLIYEKAEDTVKPIIQELWDMYEKALELENELKEIGKKTKKLYIGNKDPVGHKGLFLDTISPFDIICQGDLTEKSRITERRKIAERKDLI